MSKRRLALDDADFAMPGTPASIKRGRQATSSAASDVTKTKKKSRKGQPTRDFSAQLDKVFPNPGDMQAARATFDKFHYRPVAPTTHQRHANAERLWRVFFNRQIGEAATEDSLKRGAPMLPTADIKQFMYFVATTGKSGLGQGLKGWTVHTTRIFLSDTWSMVSR